MEDKSKQITEFFAAIYKDIPDNLYINIWTLPDKRSYWFKGIISIAPLVVTLGGKDVYFSVGLANKEYGPYKRLKADEVAGITCLWCDVDFGPGHSKKVPPDEKTAGELVRSCGLHPSLVVHSGNGWHCYWLLDKPYIFETDGERRAAAQLVEQWQNHIRSIFKQAGYELDATHDLSRVLRIPGTLNHKHGNKIGVDVRWPT
ncbi:MAG: hypothetical protein JW860_02610 [Sedimentisphaerales bacterium]|nr:hypothetical protein [Sedimentisphaerales bacterium]